MSTTHVIMSYKWNTSSTEKLDTLSFKEEVARVANLELREDKFTREQALQQFRQWIEENSDICNSWTDDSFLLRFLRVKKFSLPMAQQVLLKYINLRQTFSHLLYNLDYLHPNINELFNNGYIYASPFRDSNGRRVILYNIDKFDPHKYKNIEMAKVHMITYEVLMDDEDSQVMGFTHIGNIMNALPAHATIWSPMEFSTLIRWGEMVKKNSFGIPEHQNNKTKQDDGQVKTAVQQFLYSQSHRFFDDDIQKLVHRWNKCLNIEGAYVEKKAMDGVTGCVKLQSVPMRHKEVHLINVPAPLRYMYDMISSILTEKMRSRLKIHDSLDSLNKGVNPKVLPKELGGTMPMAEMIELWKKELAAKRDRILKLDEIKLLSTRSIITRRNNQNQTDNSSALVNSIQGSFRKLQVD